MEFIPDVLGFVASLAAAGLIGMAWEAIRLRIRWPASKRQRPVTKSVKEDHHG